MRVSQLHHKAHAKAKSKLPLLIGGHILTKWENAWVMHWIILEVRLLERSLRA
jgi:hypothetical protein